MDEGGGIGPDDDGLNLPEWQNGYFNAVPDVDVPDTMSCGDYYRRLCASRYVDDPGRKAGELNRRKGDERRALFIDYTENGWTVARISQEMRMSELTYLKWVKRHPEFAALVRLARSRGKAPENRYWKGDFYAFRKEFFGYDTYFHQAQIVEAIENSPDQGVTMVLVPPEHGKTTVIEDWICYKLAVDPNIRIGVVSEGQPHARKILRRVKQRMTAKGPYVAKFGPFYVAGQERDNKPWSADMITVYKADHDERDYSVVACGWRSAVAGSRFDILIADDIMSRKNLSQADEVVQTFRQDFLTRPGVIGKTVITGTRVDVGDFYSQMKEAGNDATGDKVLTDLIELPAADADGNPLCPEMWPKEALARKRTIVGEDVWWRNYQQQPRSHSLATFNVDMIDACKNPYLRLGEPIEHGLVLLSLDPALGGGNALTALSYDATRIRILDQVCDRGLARVEEIAARVAEFAARYNPRDLVIETMDFQKGLEHDDRLQELAAIHGFSIIPHLTGGGGVRKKDEIIGVAQMPKAFLSGQFEIPWADQLTRERLQPLIDELLNWSPNIPTRRLVQDRVMSLWFGWIVARERMRLLNVDSSSWRTRAMPYAPAAYQPVAVAR